MENEKCKMAGQSPLPFAFSILQYSFYIFYFSTGPLFFTAFFFHQARQPVTHSDLRMGSRLLCWSVQRTSSSPSTASGWLSSRTRSCFRNVSFCVRRTQSLLVKASGSYALSSALIRICESELRLARAATTGERS